MYNISLDRYYNRSDEVSHSDYKSVLFRAGDSIQSAEMNETQSVMKKSISDLSRKFVTNGGIISGLEIDTSYDLNGNQDGNLNDLHDITINSSEGVIFVEGEYINVSPSTIVAVDELLSTSDLIIGAKVTYEEITHEDDASLLDPALETRNQGQPGSGRLKITAELIFESDFVDTTDVEFYELYRVVNGEIYVKAVDNADGFEQYRKDVVDIAAKYDRNSNGNYLIEGHETKFVGTDNPFSGVSGTNIGPFWFSVADGSANVDGYNFENNFSRYVDSSALLDYEIKQNEPTTFNGDGWYSVRHTPIRKGLRVTGVKEELNLAISHGSFAGSNDEIPAQFQPVLSVQSITQGATTFIAGVDYSLVGDTIYWLNGGNEPAPSSTYYVNFQYQYTEIEGAFTSDGNAVMCDVSPDLSKLYIHGFVQGSLVQFDYDFILKRVDVIFINSRGNLDTIKGVPAEDTPRVPENDPEKTLKIAEVLLSGNSEPIVTISTNRTFKMEDIQTLLDGIRTSRYDISRLALEIDMIRKQPGTSLRGQFVDNFKDDDYRDDGLLNDAISMEGNLIMNIDWTSQNVVPEIPNDNFTKFTYNLSTTPNVIPVLSQPHYSMSRKVNSYLFSAPPEANIKISPSIYRWVDRNNWISTTRTRQGTTRIFDQNSNLWGWRTTRSVDWMPEIAQTQNTVESITPIRDSVIIPQINLSIKSNYGAFNANEEVEITMDGISAGSINADSNGTLSGNFVVPENSLSGSKSVEAMGVDSMARGSALFKAEPLSRTMTTTITRWWNWVGRVVWRVRRDPLAQSFVLENDTVLDKIEVQFAVKSLTDTICILCETTAGVPDKTKTLATSEVLVGDLVEVGNRQPFVFENKVVLTGLKEYAFIIMNADPVAELQVARLGDKSLDAPVKWLTDPAYMAGVLFSSSNNSAWTPHQKEDLRFWLYDCTFASEEDFGYTEVSVTDATDLIVMANAKEFEGTSVNYSIELLDRVATDTVPNIYKITPYDQIPLTVAYSGRVRLTSTLKSNGAKSPMLDEDIQIGVGVSSRTSTYTSIGVSIDSDDIQAVAHIDCFEPSNTSINMQIQVVDPVSKIVSWENMTRSNIVTQQGGDWKELKYTFNLQNGGNVIDVDQNETRIRINMTTTNDIDRPVVGNLRFNTTKI